MSELAEKLKQVAADRAPDYLNNLARHLRDAPLELNTSGKPGEAAILAGFRADGFLNADNHAEPGIAEALDEVFAPAVV